jgi:hypothetical protein
MMTLKLTQADNKQIAQRVQGAERRLNELLRRCPSTSLSIEIGHSIGAALGALSPTSKRIGPGRYEVWLETTV